MGYAANTDRRWETLTKDQEQEFAYFNSTEGRGDARKIELDAFMKLKPEIRETMYRAAVASLIDIDTLVPLKALAKEIPLKPRTWLEHLRAGFFGKYRADQLLDYLKKSGAGRPIDGKKSNAVACALGASAEKTAWQFGLD